MIGYQRRTIQGQDGICCYASQYRADEITNGSARRLAIAFFCRFRKPSIRLCALL
jgi:hypothetical protein